MFLRQKLLAGRRIALGGSVGAPTIDRLRSLGAELEHLDAEHLHGDEEQVGEWARTHAPLHALVWSGANAFGGGGVDGLTATLDQAWAAVREVAVGTLIPARAPSKLLLVAPRLGAGPLAEAARAGLENLVRTLSVEWSRYRLTSVLIAPGGAADDDDLAELASFVVSEAGEYLSGCRLDLGALS